MLERLVSFFAPGDFCKMLRNINDPRVAGPAFLRGTSIDNEHSAAQKLWASRALRTESEPPKILRKLVRDETVKQ